MIAKVLPRLAPGVELNPVEDGSVIYHPETDQVHFLNATASVVVELCDGEHDVDAIEQALVEISEAEDLDFDVHAAVIEPLVEQGVLRTEGSTS